MPACRLAGKKISDSWRLSPLVCFCLRLSQMAIVLTGCHHQEKLQSPGPANLKVVVTALPQLTYCGRCWGRKTSLSPACKWAKCKRYSSRQFFSDRQKDPKAPRQNQNRKEQRVGSNEPNILLAHFCLPSSFSSETRYSYYIQN